MTGEKSVIPEFQETTDERFVQEALREHAGNLARLSVGRTPIADFRKGTDDEIEGFLARVEVDDRKLAESVQKGLEAESISPQAIFDGVALSAAKAEVAAQNAAPKEAGFLHRFSNRLINKAVGVLTSELNWDHRKFVTKTVPAFALVATLSACSGGLGEVSPGPIDVETPTPTTGEVIQPTELFTAENSVGYDYNLHEFVVLDENGCFLGLFGDGVFDNGVTVNVLYHLRGGRIKDVPIAWVAKDSQGNITTSGSIIASSYIDSTK